MTKYTLQQDSERYLIALAMWDDVCSIAEGGIPSRDYTTIAIAKSNRTTKTVATLSKSRCRDAIV
jgi:hypothetical protein